MVSAKQRRAQAKFKRMAKARAKKLRRAKIKRLMAELKRLRRKH